MKVVRAARQSDWLAAAHIHVAGWQYAYAGHMPNDYLAELTPEGHSGWRKTAYANRHPLAHHIVALDDRTIVGFADVGRSRTDHDDGEVYAIYVDPNRIGTGIGRMLIRAARRVMKTIGYTRAELWVLDANDRARQFYAADGWIADTTTKTEQFGDRTITEARYVRNL